MKVGRAVLSVTAVVSTVLALGLVTAGPAAAWERGVWRAYGKTNPVASSSSRWSCGSSSTIAVNVVAQTCAIRSSGGNTVQAAVIVRNNRSSLANVAGQVELWRARSGLQPGQGSAAAIRSGMWMCPYSGVGAHSWSVCFGRSLYIGARVSSSADVLGRDLTRSPSRGI